MCRKNSKVTPPKTESFLLFRGNCRIVPSREWRGFDRVPFPSNVAGCLSSPCCAASARSEDFRQPSELGRIVNIGELDKYEIRAGPRLPSVTGTRRDGSKCHPITGRLVSVTAASLEGSARRTFKYPGSPQPSQAFYLAGWLGYSRIDHAIVYWRNGQRCKAFRRFFGSSGASYLGQITR